MNQTCPNFTEDVELLSPKYSEREERKVRGSSLKVTERDFMKCMYKDYSIA